MTGEGESSMKGDCCFGSRQCGCGDECLLDRRKTTLYCIHRTKRVCCLRRVDMTRGSVVKGEVVHSWCLDVFLLSVLRIRQVDRECPLPRLRHKSVFRVILYDGFE